MDVLPVFLRTVTIAEPELASVRFDEILTDKTGFYYYHTENEEEFEGVSSNYISTWEKVHHDTVLAPEGIVRAYIAYTIPAGALNSTNTTARFRLPDGLELTDAQIESINKNKNGFGFAGVTVEITCMYRRVF